MLTFNSYMDNMWPTLHSQGFRLVLDLSYVPPSYSILCVCVDSSRIDLSPPYNTYIILCCINFSVPHDFFLLLQLSNFSHADFRYDYDDPLFHHTVNLLFKEII